MKSCLFLLLVVSSHLPSFAQSALEASGSVTFAAQSQENGSSDPLLVPKRLIEQNKLDDAIASLRSIQQSHPETKGLDYQLGLALYRKNEFAEAQSALARAMEKDPFNREAVQLRGSRPLLARRPRRGGRGTESRHREQ